MKISTFRKPKEAGPAFGKSVIPSRVSGSPVSRRLVTESIPANIHKGGLRPGAGLPQTRGGVSLILVG